MDCKITKDRDGRDGGETLVIMVPLAKKPWPYSSTGKTVLPYSSGGAVSVSANGYAFKINLVVMAKPER